MAQAKCWSCIAIVHLTGRVQMYRPSEIDFGKMVKFMITRIIIINHVIWRLAIFFFCSFLFFICFVQMWDAHKSKEKHLSSNSIYENWEIIHFTFRFMPRSDLLRIIAITMQIEHNWIPSELFFFKFFILSSMFNILSVERKDHS